MYIEPHSHPHYHKRLYTHTYILTSTLTPTFSHRYSCILTHRPTHSHLHSYLTHTDHQITPQHITAHRPDRMAKWVEQSSPVLGYRGIQTSSVWTLVKSNQWLYDRYVLLASQALDMTHLHPPTSLPALSTTTHTNKHSTLLLSHPHQSNLACKTTNKQIPHWSSNSSC